MEAFNPSVPERTPVDRERKKPTLLGERWTFKVSAGTEIEQTIGFQVELWLPSEERCCDQGCILCTLTSWKSHVEEINVTVGCYAK